MTIPFDIMASRAERPAVADRGSAIRDRGPRDGGFPDAFRSAVDAGSRDRDCPDQACSGDRSSAADRTQRPGDRSVTAADRTAQHRGAQRSTRPDAHERRPVETDTDARAAVLTALRPDGLSADALHAVAALVGETPASTEQLAAVLDSIEVAVPADEAAALLAERDAEAAAETVVPELDPDGARFADVISAEPTTAVAGDVQATATTVVADEVTDTPAASRIGQDRGQNQGNGPSTTGARGLARAAEVAADGARVHDLAAVDAEADVAPPQRAAATVLSAAERAFAGRNAGAETTDTVRLPVSPISGEPAPIQGLAQGRIPTDRGATPGAASVQRVLDALELLESAPPPRQITLELGDARVRVALDDGQVRLSVVGAGNDAVERWLEETRAALEQRGFDLGQQTGERTDDQSDGDRPPSMAGATTATDATVTRDDGGALLL